MSVLFLTLLCLTGCATGLQSVKPPESRATELRLGALEKRVDHMSQEMALMKNTQTLDAFLIELMRAPFFWIVALVLVGGLVGLIVTFFDAVMPLFRSRGQAGRKK